jgi:hypothetical protein
VGLRQVLLLLEQLRQVLLPVFRLELPVVGLQFWACLYTRQRRVQQWKEVLMLFFSPATSWFFNSFLLLTYLLDMIQEKRLENKRVELLDFSKEYSG